MITTCNNSKLQLGNVMPDNLRTLDLSNLVSDSTRVCGNLLERSTFHAYIETFMLPGKTTTCMLAIVCVCARACVYII